MWSVDIVCKGLSNSHFGS